MSFLSSENTALEIMNVLDSARCIKLSQSSNIFILIFTSCFSSVWGSALLIKIEAKKLNAMLVVYFHYTDLIYLTK